jgi:hypothetical protein
MEGDMKEKATIKIFLVNGNPDSVRTAEISNWAGKAVAGPRSQLELILRREEANKTGVYFLTGINPETGKQKVCIGAADIVRTQIKGHLDQDFWRTIIFFVNKYENLTKAQVKYVEHRLIEMAKAADRFEVDNGNSSAPYLPESHAADMKGFLAKIEQVLPVLRQDFLTPISETASAPKVADLQFSGVKDVDGIGSPV